MVGIEPTSSWVATTVLTIFTAVDPEGIEPSSNMDISHALTTSEMRSVLPLGIEPSSLVLQTSANPSQLEQQDATLPNPSTHVN